MTILQSPTASLLAGSRDEHLPPSHKRKHGSILEDSTNPALVCSEIAYEVRVSGAFYVR